VIQLLEVLGSNSKIFLILEYIEGGELSEKLNGNKKLEEKKA
jgi:hypothetical protein